ASTQPAVPQAAQLAALTSPTAITVAPPPAVKVIAPIKLTPPVKLTMVPKPRPVVPKLTVNLRAPASDDEDAAERRRAPDDGLLTPVLPKPKPIVIAAYKPQKP